MVQAIYPINSPYTKAQAMSNVLFSNFSSPPKHLDPARAYSSDEYLFIAQIYEPAYQYHYLIRPYKLEPLSSEDYIKVDYLDQYRNIIDNNKLNNSNNLDKSGSSEEINNKKIKYTSYTVKIKKNIFYQPHPSFVIDKNNDYIYQNLDQDFINKLDSISNFDYLKLNKNIINNTRELEANDFVYQLKRIADPKNQSPIYSLMANYILDLDKLNTKLHNLRQESESKNNNNIYIDLNQYNIDGIKLLDKYTYQIIIKGRYPQFKYWFAMPFFAPVPWEVDKFYSQPGLKEQNISLDTYPVGTGPYMLTENNPNRRMILEKNPYYNHGFYPSDGMPEDETNKLLDKSNQKLPFIEKILFYLEKESIPIWNKFLQGYYDFAGISSDNFDQAIEISNNSIDLSDVMKEKGIKLVKTVEPSIFYWGFNMLDDTIGGYSEKHRKLRQAISIVFDVDEYINIFRNGRGIVAHSPIPPGITDVNSDLNINKYLYDNKDSKKDIKYANQLLEEAGYHNGIDKSTGNPLVINFDAVTSGSPSDGAVFNWLRKQFEKLDIKLNIRATQYNRFRDKISSGTAQMYFWGWNADYPDPENFLFLFLCNQARVKHNGENSSNYCNPEYDDLFNKLQDTDNIEIKNKYIIQMVNILQKDSPWIFGFYNELYQLRHNWINPSKPLAVGNNNLKYLSLDPNARVQNQIKWNKAIIWPIIIFILIFIVVLVPVSVSYYRKNHMPRVC